MELGYRSPRQIILRCPYCGDSEDPQSGHLSIDPVTGMYHCFRCKAGGKLPVRILFSLLQAQNMEVYLATDIDGEDGEEKEEKGLIYYPGAGTIRPSLLPRFHTAEGHDAFESFDSLGNLVGVQVRKPGKQHYTVGKTLFAWADPRGLVSTVDDPLTLVEGPYDVVDERDVAVFGVIHKKALKRLAGHYVILKPDGDVYQKPDLRRGFIAMLKARSELRATIVGIDVLLSGKDPDEADEGDIIQLRSDRDIDYLVKLLQ